MAIRTQPATGRQAGLTGTVERLPALLNLPGSVCKVRFRGASVTVVAGLACSRGDDRTPLTDVLALELASGSGQNMTWPRPVAIHAVVVAGLDVPGAVRRASRWASYASRVAVAPIARISDQARAEAVLRGVWLVAAGAQASVVVPGEVGPTPGSERGLLHRLLDELVFEALQAPAAAGQSGNVRRSASAAKPSVR